MSHHVPGPPDYDVVMTEQVPGLNGPKMLGRHKPTAPYWGTFFKKVFFAPMKCQTLVKIFKIQKSAKNG